MHVLSRDGDFTSPVFKPQFAKRNPIYSDLAFRGIIEPCKQMKERGLARAGGTHNRRHLSFRDSKTHLTKRVISAILIPEADPAKLYFFAQIFEGHGT